MLSATADNRLIKPTELTLTRLPPPGAGGLIGAGYTKAGAAVEKLVNRTTDRFGIAWGPDAVTHEIQTLLGDGCDSLLTELYYFLSLEPLKPSQSMRQLKKWCRKLVEYADGLETGSSQLQTFRSIVMLITCYPGLRRMLLYSAENSLPDRISSLQRPVGVALHEWLFFRDFAAFAVSENDINKIVEQCPPNQLGFASDSDGFSIIERLLGFVRDSSLTGQGTDLPKLLAVRCLTGILRLPSFWQSSDWRIPHSHQSQIAAKLCDVGAQLVEDAPSDIGKEEMAKLDVEGVDMYLNTLMTGLYSNWMTHTGRGSSLQDREWFKSHGKLILVLLNDKASVSFPRASDNAIGFHLRTGHYDCIEFEDVWEECSATGEVEGTQSAPQTHTTGPTSASRYKSPQHVSSSPHPIIPIPLQNSTPPIPPGAEGPRDEEDLTRVIGYLTATASEDWALVLEVCERVSMSESNAKEAVRALRRELKYGEPSAQLSAARLWAIMLRNSTEEFISQSTSRKFLNVLENLILSPRTSPVVRERAMDVVGAAAYAAYASGNKKDTKFHGLWRKVKPPGKPDEGVPFDTDDSMYNPPVSGRLSAAYDIPLPTSTFQDSTPESDMPFIVPAVGAVDPHAEQGDLQHHDTETPRDEDGDLTSLIGYLTATPSEDWTLLLEVCERASMSESNAKEAVGALRREFKYGEPSAQLSAARLWAIMLHNSTETFISQSTSRKFLDAVKDLLLSPRTSPVVRERVMDVVSAAAYAAYASGNKKDTGFRRLWRKVKPPGKPDEGVPFDTDDPMFNPPVSGRLSTTYDLPPLTSTFQDPTSITPESGIPFTPQPVVQQQQIQPPKEHKEKKRRKSPSRHNRIIPPEEDIRRLFQQCKIGQGNASLLSQALAMARPEDLDEMRKGSRGGVIREFHAKCVSSQELICAQIEWATAGAERSRALKDAEKGEEAKKMQENGEEPPAELTVEENLLAALLGANAELLEALKQYDDFERVGLERKVEGHSRKEVRMDQRLLDEASSLIDTVAGDSRSSPSQKYNSLLIQPTPVSASGNISRKSLRPLPAVPAGPRSPA